MLASLTDGTLLDIRPIRPYDKPLLANGLQRLSPETVEKRFLSPKLRFTTAELRYLTEVDMHDHVALVALRAGQPDRLVAVARFVRLPDDPRTAEAAIVVADELQGRGVGRRLALLLADHARARGITRFVATFRGDNIPAQRLMATIAKRLEAGPLGAGTVDLVAELAA